MPRQAEDSALRASPERVQLIRDAGYWLHLIRAIEEAGRRLYLQGRLPGSFYDGHGQEATAVGAGLALGTHDVACPLIRDMAVHLIRGVTPPEMFRHYLGKAGAPMEGRDGNIHVGAFHRGTIPMISHLPEMLPVGMGVAVSRQRRGLPSAALGFCGDGATAGGVFHETLNLAAVWKAPLVVLIERNHYAYTTAESSYLPIERLSDRAVGYGALSATVDGNDVVEVYERVTEALDHARSGGGPMIVEAFTYRMHGHGAHDAQQYVPADELEHWRKRDPLRKWRERATSEAGWTDEEQHDLEARIGQTVDEALQDALDAPYPDPSDLEASIFAR